ncbi:MAG: phosphate ABC transporter substrate-binding protein [Dehalococcoidia bacterium]|nr:phosphate ABC transporter substrate-binding protein [Dehalococcoidia bacterium]
MKKSFRILSVSVAVLVLGAMLATGCSSQGGSITIGGSTTVQPLSEVWADAFMSQNDGIEIAVQGGGSSAGVKGAAEDVLDIGAASREVKSEELSKWTDLKIFRVAADGVAICVHPSRDIENLTLDEVRAIYMAGSNDEWTVISREEGSGTREVFEEKVMDGEKIAAKAEFLPSNGAVKQKLATTQNGIAFLSLGYVDSSVKPVTVNGVECTEDTILDGSYPVMRYLNYITKGDPAGSVKEFIDWALSAEGQAMVAAEGYIPLK